MSGYILDCCTLLNLYCGWGGLRELSVVYGPWMVGSKAWAECKYVREFDVKGQVVPQPLDHAATLQQHSIGVLAMQTSLEIELFVEIAKRLEDGEAECLAIAANRSLTLCSDEKLAQDEAVKLGVAITTTPEILQKWASRNSSNAAALPSVISRIETLGKFTPHKTSSYLVWWKNQRLAR